MNQDSKVILGCVHEIIEQNKGFNVVTVDVGDVCQFTDYFVIAECFVEKHVRAMSEVIVRGLRKRSTKVLSSDCSGGAGWAVVDCGTVVVHLFTPKERDFYKIESLWCDGVLI